MIKRLLIFRFSAMGDVLLTLPILQQVVETYPAIELVFVTRPQWADYFTGLPRTTILTVDLDKDYQGIMGLWRLFRRLRQEKIATVLDLHDNLRTKLLRLFLGLVGVEIFVYDKGRRERKILIQKQDKKVFLLPHVTQRYADCFAQAGFPIDYTAIPSASLKATADLSALDVYLHSNRQLLGIAPFAKHANKMWSLTKMQALIQELLAKHPSLCIFLFGSKKEAEILDSWQKIDPTRLVSVAGRLTGQAEITLMSRFDAMLTMDSSNLHLAALTGVKVVSIWGATHPYLGFSPFQQSDKNCVQIPIEELSCRPCSVFGDKKCWRGDTACMEQISVEQVHLALEKVLDRA